MMYILVNMSTGNYFKREQMNGVCIDVDTIEEARTFDSKFKAERKAMFLSEKDHYAVIAINN